MTSFSGLAHPYNAQPSYQAGTPDTITVSVTDPYEPLNPATGTATVAITPADDLRPDDLDRLLHDQREWDRSTSREP